MGWQDREQEGISACQEEQLHQGLDDCRPKGQESTGPEGLRRDQEGLRILQEGQGTLPEVSVHEPAEASARGVGMSTPFERRRFDWPVLLWVPLMKDVTHCKK